MEAPKECFVRSCVVDSCICSVFWESQGFLTLNLLGLSLQWLAVTFCVLQAPSILLQKLFSPNMPKLALLLSTERNISHVR